MKKEKALELIKKVMAKADNNSNENEVQVAMLKAQELMIKYGIEMSEVKTKGNKATDEALEDSLNSNGKMNWYNSLLASVIADNFRCEYFIRVGSKIKYMMFVGLKDDIEIAKEIYSYANDSLEYFTDKYIKNLRYEDLTNDILNNQEYYNECKNSYISGFIRGLEQKYKEQVEQNEWGLMIVKPEAVLDYVSKMSFTKGRKNSIKSSGDFSHFTSGFEEGKKLEHRKDLLKDKA